jgi:hypothetical protein
MLKIGPELVLCIRPLREEPRGIKLTQVERSGRGEILYRDGQLKIQIEESVISHVPETGDSRCGGIAPEPVWTSHNRVFEHVDGGAELSPEDRVPTRI